jgi:hypothetical protein
MLRGAVGNVKLHLAAFVVKETHIFGQILYIPPEINKKTISISLTLVHVQLTRFKDNLFYSYNLCSF